MVHPKAIMTITRRTFVGGLAGSIAATAVGVPGTAGAGTPRLTNLTHLSFLCDRVAPPAAKGHTTYDLSSSASVGVLWVGAEHQENGTYARRGGGVYDPATNTYGQGAYNADQIARAAVVYLRHWKCTGSPDSGKAAYELLRGLTFLQTARGPHAGNVVLWMQPDGTLNPSAEPAELPDSSDSGPSYWLARTIWALGEGYEAFRSHDPAFATFLQDRLELAVLAIEPRPLPHLDQASHAAGRISTWPFAGGSDAEAAAVLGLAAYLRAGGSARATQALGRLSKEIAATAGGRSHLQRFRAMLPWGESVSSWHAWNAQASSALAAASGTDHSLLHAAVGDAAGITPLLLTARGFGHSRLPAPADRTRIAYNVDARLQGLLNVAAAARRPGLREVAAFAAAWYFGANAAGSAMYDSTTGRTYDGISGDGVVNLDSGAESTIHGLLSMLALDAVPGLATLAQRLSAIQGGSGLSWVEAESGSLSGGAKVVTPYSAWAGETRWSNSSYIALPGGGRSSWTVPASSQPRLVAPVVDVVTGDGRWRSGQHELGMGDHRGQPPPGSSGAPVTLWPTLLERPLPAGATELSVDGVGTSELRVDGIVLVPAVSELRLSGGTLLVSAGDTRQDVVLPQRGFIRTYDYRGVLQAERRSSASARVLPGGFTVVLDH